ncbi:MAG TPA: MnhB domain-containing protein [Polyangia bacterium]|nr:MnhB domain-containing protein [Polyangia bacterium]
MTKRGRSVLFGAGALGCLAVLAVGASGLPATGSARSATGDLLARVAEPERHAMDAVAAVTFDYRGFDTLGEEFILYASVLGVRLLLRDQRHTRKTEDERPESRTAPAPSDAVRVMSLALVGVTVVVGLSVVAHGHQTPGGGFQGGVLLSNAPLLAYLATAPEMLPRIAPGWLIEAAESVGVLAFAAIGLWGLAATGAFMQNVLPLGRVGHLLSAGTIPILNVATGLAVAGGLLMLVSAFLQKARQADDRGGRT